MIQLIKTVESIFSQHNSHVHTVKQVHGNGIRWLAFVPQTDDKTTRNTTNTKSRWPLKQYRIIIQSKQNRQQRESECERGTYCVLVLLCPVIVIVIVALKQLGCCIICGAVQTTQ